jgi:hypothetical protein
MALALFGALSLTAAAAAEPGSCEVPEHLAHGGGQLARVAAAVTKERKLDIVVVGTGSSVLAGTEGARTAYPARLEAELMRQLPGVAVSVRTDVKSRRTAVEMEKTLEQIVLDSKPALVVWQTGTVDAMRGVDPEEFRSALEEGIQAVKTAGADVVLVNMQYSPRTESMIAATSYAENMRWVAQQYDVPLFDRLGIMRHWNETGAFDLGAHPSQNRLAEGVHDCLGKLLAELILNAAQLPRTESKG